MRVKYQERTGALRLLSLLMLPGAAYRAISTGNFASMMM